MIIRRPPRALLALTLAGGIALAPAGLASVHAAPSAAAHVRAGTERTNLGEAGILNKLGLLSTLATSCNTTTGALTTALQAGGKSVLAICQTTNPSATASGLATTLSAAAKTALDSAVSSGKLTAAQESEILSDIQAHLTTWLTTPLGPGGIGGGQAVVRVGIGMDLDSVAQVLGVTTTVLQQDLQAGQTLLQIAGSKYASAHELAVALLANVKTKLDSAVSAGKMTADQENQVYQEMLTKAEALVTTPHPDLPSATGRRGVEGFGMLNKLNLLSTLATSCNTTTDALTTAFKAGGKSVLAICQATNPSATASGLATALTAAAKTALDSAVSSGKLTAMQESEMLSNLQTKLTTWLTTPLPAAGTDGKA